MKIRELIVQLEKLIEEGEDSVMVFYYDRELWNKLSQEELSKDDFSDIAYDVSCNMDCSRLFDDISCFIDFD